MLSLIILLLILTALTLHRYLSVFLENKLLPYPMGFSIFFAILTLLYSINFIWMFGLLGGLVLALLALFQIINATFLWPFLIPTLIKLRENNGMPKVNMTKYAIWSTIIPIIAILTIINFFISDYKSLWTNIKPFINENFSFVIIISLIALIISHFVRISTMKKMAERDKSII